MSDTTKGGGRNGDRGPGRTEGGAKGSGGKPFVPRSRGMRSHGGAPINQDDKTVRPKSYGRLNHEIAGGTERAKGRQPRAEDTDTVAATSMPGTMRIARRLARAGIASRRDAEGMIADGRIKVNGKKLASPALDVSASDRIEIDNSPLPAIERTRLWLFHKIAGTVTTNRDPEGRATIFDRLPEQMPRVLTVGRLDINTEGLLLLTNDGGLSRVLELPSTGWLRRYRVRAHGSITQAKLDELRQGIAVDGVFYGAIDATLDKDQGSNVWLTVGLREGKNREVKKVLGHLGLEVNRLIRISYGPFQLGDLKEGAVQEIRGRTLRDQLGERLIEEAGADFDAPVARAFSNRPVEPQAVEKTSKPKRDGDWISASETAPNKKRMREKGRRDALSKLDTGRERGGRFARDRSFGEDRSPRKGAGPFNESSNKTEKRRTEESGETSQRKLVDAPKRSANVWMAPGARPQGTRKARSSHSADFQRRSQRSGGPGEGGRNPATPHGPVRGKRPTRPSGPRHPKKD